MEEENEKEEVEEKKQDIFIPQEIYEKEFSEIKRNPRNYICNWMEKNLMHVGSDVFKYVSLMPCSLVLPDIPFNSTGIKPNFNLLIVGDPSVGKTTISNKFCNLTINPIKVKKMSAGEMIVRLIREKMFSISIDDFANLMNDADGYAKIKTLEGAVGDDRMLSADTMRYQTGEVRVQGVALIAITPMDLARYVEYMKSGLFSRMTILWLYLSKQKNDDISRYIADGIGNYNSREDLLIKEKIIKDYYQSLYDIQFQKNSSIQRIVGYEINNDIKDRAFKLWKSTIEDANIPESGNFKRDFHDFFRFLISNAFLNIYNREHKNGILKPNEEDAEVALSLMSKSLKTKTMLHQIQDQAKMLQNPKKFISYIQQNPKIRNDIKKLMAVLSGNGNLLDSMEQIEKLKEVKK